MFASAFSTFNIGSTMATGRVAIGTGTSATELDGGTIFFDPEYQGRRDNKRRTKRLVGQQPIERAVQIDAHAKSDDDCEENADASAT